MQIWKWLLILGLLFLITYNPSRGGGSKLVNYFTNDSIGGNGQFPRDAPQKGETQKHSNTGDDD